MTRCQHGWRNPADCECCQLIERIAKAPAWHDKPTCAGLWFSIEADGHPGSHQIRRPMDAAMDASWEDGSRYYGPIPEDAP